MRHLQSAVWRGRRLLPPPGWWPACAVGVGAALVALVGLGAAVGFWALFLAVTVGGYVTIAPPPRFWPSRLADHRPALTLAYAAGVIAAAAGLAALLVMYSFLAGRHEYIPSGGSEYGIIDAGRLFAGDTRALANAAGLAVAGIAGSLAVIVGRHCHHILGCAAGRSALLIFFTVAIAAVAAATAVGFSAIVFAQPKVAEVAETAFYNSPYHIPPEPAPGIGPALSSVPSINPEGLLLLTLSVVSAGVVIVSVLAAFLIVARIVSRILKGLIPGGRSPNAIARGAFAAGGAVVLAAVPAWAMLRYAAAGSPYPYFGSPPDGWALAAWYALVAASLLMVAVGPVLLSAAIAAIIAKAFAAVANAPPPGP